MSIFEDVADAPAPETTGGSGGGTVPTAEGGKEPGRGKRRKTIIALIIILALLLLVGGIFVWYLITHKPITALPIVPQSQTPGYQYSILNVQQPLGVAVNSDGSRIYITQSAGPGTTIVVDRSGKTLATLVPPKSTGKMHEPVYVAISPVTGNVFVSDRDTGAIYVYSSEGKFLQTLAHKGVTGLWIPLGLGFDQAGNLYVTEALPKTSRVFVMSPQGQVERILKSPTSMSFPNGVAVDSKGNVVVTDSNNGRALIFDAQGKVAWTISAGSAPGDLGLPRGAAFDSQGHLDIVDTTDQSVRVYQLKPKGAINFLGSFGDQGVGNGLFQYPNGAAADSRAHVYITDRVNNRVQVWSY